jgi:alkylated DNA repair dioxygenase AlkB
MDPQLPFFSDQESLHIPLQDGELLYHPHFFAPGEADQLLAALRHGLHWQQECMMMYGKPVLFPRLMAWYGDAGSHYSFSGKTYQPAAWTKELQLIHERISPIAGVAFNSVLANLYRNGQDSMGWHADDEPELGLNPVIASVNFGAARRFMLRHKKEKDLRYELTLQHGSLLVMKGTLQHHWQHQVPKTTKPLGERINLTFRVIRHTP